MAKVKKMFAYKLNDKTLYIGELVGEVGFGRLLHAEFIPNGVVGAMVADVIREWQPFAAWKDAEWGNALYVDALTLDDVGEFEKWLSEKVPEVLLEFNRFVEWMQQHDFTFDE